MDATTDLVVRPLEAHERGDALRLWYTVFNCPAGYFERYFDADPWYRLGDTLGAWTRGGLVSAVHVCRRPLHWEGTPLLCGGIANVATLPAHRRGGLSRQVLRAMIAHMGSAGFDFSVLETGIFDFYAKLGWEQILLPRWSIVLPNQQADPGSALQSRKPVRDKIAPARASASQQAVYEQMPRPLQLQRTPEYTRGWAEWNWNTKSAVIHGPSRDGYVIHTPAEVLEWRADTAEREIKLLAGAIAFARSRGRARVDFSTLPQFADLAALESLGTIERAAGGALMIRNIRLTDSQWKQARQAYESGSAVWWPADDF